MIVVGFEAVAGAKVLTYWFDAQLWLLSLGPHRRLTPGSQHEQHPGGG
ncbi:MAG: hypothetical protein ACR2FG_11650 [Marmoricola sp.]